ncbi:MAG: deoxyhypusine synthase family protein, partial [Thaumarchaeota archaeon]|nr:deoxyhypusine synthase family protein [Nitrososphaerota archaeon]
MRISDLLDQLEDSGGFAAKYLGAATRILKTMLKDRECIRFLSFVAAPIATGLRGVLAEAVKRGFFDVIVTTCGSLDHDIARALSNYYNGDFWIDDVKLKEEGFHRLGSVLVPLESYGSTIERFMQDLLEEAYGEGVRELGSYEVADLIGRRLQDE